jgi:hypothetical protein
MAIAAPDNKDELRDFHWKPYADASKSYIGMKASIESNGGYTLPWSIVLEDRRRLADCGSYSTAIREFQRLGLTY